MKKLTSMIILGSLVAFSSMAKTTNVATDPMGIAGLYACKGFDAHEGEYSGRFMLVRDENASDVKSNFGAYQSTPVSPAEKNEIHGYMEYMAVQDNHAAMYFEHKDNKKDAGVKMFTVSQAKNNDGHLITTLSGPYYEPAYHRETTKRSGYGNATCIQQVK